MHVGWYRLSAAGLASLCGAKAVATRLLHVHNARLETVLRAVAAVLERGSPLLVG